MPPFVKKFFTPEQPKASHSAEDIERQESERNEKIRVLTNKLNAITTLRYMQGKEVDKEYGDLVTESINIQDELRSLGVNIGEEIEA